MSALVDLASIAPLQIWQGVLARAVQGERVMLAVVELEPGSIVPQHHHEHEQLGIVLTGLMTFTVGDETRELGPGGMWRIPSNTPHAVQAGPEGAVVIDIFAPVREDWAPLERRQPSVPRWPAVPS